MVLSVTLLEGSGGIWLQIQTSVSDSVLVELLPFYKNQLQSWQILFCQIVMILNQNGANSSTSFSKNHLILWGSHFAKQGRQLKTRGEVQFYGKLNILPSFSPVLRRSLILLDK